MRGRGIVYAQTDRGDLLAVTDEQRSKAIKARRIAQGWTQREFARRARESREAHGISREAITAAETGQAREDTYIRLEAFLDAWEHEVGEDLPGLPPPVRVVELEIEGKAGRAIGRFPADMSAEEIRVWAASIAEGLEGSPDDK